MGDKILSICIPVYNRESDLKECLNSIEKNYVDGIEVVISDNKSTDKTVEVIKEFEKRIPIVWMTKNKHSGFDENCINVISMSTGEYCWILGSDDKVSDGGIELLISKILVGKDDVIHFSYSQDGVHTSPINESSHGDLSISDYIAKVKYIAQLKNLSLAFMFISCIAFKRKKWIDKPLLIRDSIGTNYVHAFVMHSIISSRSSIYVTNKVLVTAKLSENEWTKDVGRFLLLDCSTIVEIYKKIQFEENYFRALCGIYKRTYPISVIFKIMVAGGGDYYIESEKYLQQIGYNLLSLKILTFLQISGVIKILYKINKMRKNFYL
jgi:abequosyltransferase